MTKQSNAAAKTARKTARISTRPRSASFALLAMTVGAVSLAPALAPVRASAQTVPASPTTTVTDGVTKDQITVDFSDKTFEEEREISRVVQEVYGHGADMSNGRGPSEAVQESLQVGQPLPAGVQAKPVEAKLARRLPADAKWVAIGENLVALNDAGVVSRVYHDMLP